MQNYIINSFQRTGSYFLYLCLQELKKQYPEKIGIISHTHSPSHLLLGKDDTRQIVIARTPDHAITSFLMLAYRYKTYKDIYDNEHINSRRRDHTLQTIDKFIDSYCDYLIYGKDNPNNIFINFNDLTNKTKDIIFAVTDISVDDTFIKDVKSLATEYDKTENDHSCLPKEKDEFYKEALDFVRNTDNYKKAYESFIKMQDLCVTV